MKILGLAVLLAIEAWGQSSLGVYLNVVNPRPVINIPAAPIGTTPHAPSTIWGSQPYVVEIPGGWNGYTYWMSATGCVVSGGDCASELNEIWASNSKGSGWTYITTVVPALHPGNNFADPGLVF